ncbi:MAG: hypothetical protein WCL71_16265 [Deltaproteobacteria bacterium]
MVEEAKIYLRIRVEGQESYLKAFHNDNKTKESDPDYSGPGVMVWLNEAKPKQEMEESIKTRLEDTRKVLLEQFDEDVHSRLKMRLTDAQANLDRISRLYWTLTRFILAAHASFDDKNFTFDLHNPPKEIFRPGH